MRTTSIHFTPADAPAVSRQTAEVAARAKQQRERKAAPERPRNPLDALADLHHYVDMLAHSDRALLSAGGERREQLRFMLRLFAPLERCIEELIEAEEV
jgi:hypothetical protein